MKKLLLAVSVLTVSGVASAAAPAPLKGNCEISVDADKVTANEKDNTGVLSGNVVVTSCDMKMRTDIVHVTYVSKQPDKITATGHVVVVSQKSGIASGDSGVYDVPKKLITLEGHVVLKHDKNVLSGTHGTYNLATGIAQVDSKPSAPGSSDGRVHMVLTPPPPKNN